MDREHDQQKAKGKYMQIAEDRDFIRQSSEIKDNKQFDFYLHSVIKKHYDADKRHRKKLSKTKTIAADSAGRQVSKGLTMKSGNSS